LPDSRFAVIFDCGSGYTVRVSIFVSVQSRGTIALPPALRKAYHLDVPGAQVEILEEAGRIVLVPKVAVDASQAWFWTPAWQAGETEASRQLSAGEGVVYGSGDDFLADLP
jgi:bifunctional DNA-binding transcriptional regulator/antitoxin component of YhaV-PrlF toxin-antitoxin module